ncbi:MAG: GNAT family N-acetyltransferase [Verrucomicrobiota bacterium]
MKLEITSSCDALREGINIFRGSSKSSYLTTAIMELLKKHISLGADLRFRSIDELHLAFEESRCLYALDAHNQLVGFVYLSDVQSKQHPCMERRSLVVDPSIQGQKLGARLIQGIFELMQESYPHHSLLSITSNPIMVQSNRKNNFKEITYRELKITYGFDVIQECESHPNLSYVFHVNPLSEDALDHVEITNTFTKAPMRIFVREPKID